MTARFTLPKVISPFYTNDIKLPRKLKKRMKRYCSPHWSGLTNGERLWHYMEKDNMDYKRFIISAICVNDSLSL